MADYVVNGGLKTAAQCTTNLAAADLELGDAARLHDLNVLGILSAGSLQKVPDFLDFLRPAK